MCSSIRFLSGEVSAMLVRAFRLVAVAVVSAERSLSDILGVACTVHSCHRLFSSGLCNGQWEMDRIRVASSRTQPKPTYSIFYFPFEKSRYENNVHLTSLAIRPVGLHIHSRTFTLFFTLYYFLCMPFHFFQHGANTHT